MSEYEGRTGRKCVFKNFVHLVFVTKYRRNVINFTMLKQMQKIIEETCE
jgi:putative transposase